MSHHILLKTNSRLGQKKFPFSRLRELARNSLIGLAVFCAKLVLIGRNRKNSRFDGKSRSFPRMHRTQRQMRRSRMQTAPQGGGRQFPITRAIVSGETADTVEAVSPRDRRYAGRIRSSAPQSAVDLLHCAQPTIAAGAHTQVLLAALAQRALRHAERRADASHRQEGFSSEQILEPGKNVSMTAAGSRFHVRPF